MTDEELGRIAFCAKYPHWHEASLYEAWQEKVEAGSTWSYIRQAAAIRAALAAEQQAALAPVVKALQFYAEPLNHEPRIHFEINTTLTFSPVASDGGMQARIVLEGLEEAQP